jgi:cell division protein FtsW
VQLRFLKVRHTDFIFSVIGEETGLIGVMSIIILYGIILWRGFKISIDAAGRFESLLAFGLTASMGIQICINTGVSLGLLPAKGLALPFLSYGGSSMLMSMVTIGILMNIKASSNGTREQQKQE